MRDLVSQTSSRRIFQIMRKTWENSVCHEHERKLVMLYQRWELAS